jgi:4-hydroxy-4-methyl-2-oxoglutarate aldolase
MGMSDYSEFARLGVATVYEAAGRAGMIDLPLTRVVPVTCAAGPARPVLCGQDDNLMVHAAVAHARPGDVLVLTMPEPAPVALVGDLLATQAQVAGVAALLVDGAVRDFDELEELGLPIWARWVRVRGASKTVPGTLDEPVVVGGTQVSAGDLVVLDGDGAVVVAQDRVSEVLEASLAREEVERVKRARLREGLHSYDLDGLRERVELPSA